MDPDNIELTEDEKLEQLKRNPAEYVKTLSGVAWLDYLQSKHLSDAHKLIANHTTKRQLRSVREGSIEFKRRFYEIKEQASKSHAHDNTLAKFIDVDRVCTRVYQTLLNIIKVQQDEADVFREELAVLRKKVEFLGLGVPESQEDADALELLRAGIASFEDGTMDPSILSTDGGTK